jgi:hypothetical protein
MPQARPLTPEVVAQLPRIGHWLRPLRMGQILDGIRARPAPPGGGDELCPGWIAEPEGIRQATHGGLIRESGAAAFEVADGADAQPGPFGQFLMGQAGRVTARPETGGKRPGNYAHVWPHEQGRARRVDAVPRGGEGRQPGRLGVRSRPVLS